MTIESVLLVDDEPDIRTIGEMALTQLGGWTVWLAESGSDALAIAAERRPSVILLDVMMPGMDGPTTFERLRSLETTATTPIVFLTAKAQKHEIARYLSLGAAGVITKPFDPLTLADELRALVSGS